MRGGFAEVMPLGAQALTSTQAALLLKAYDWLQTGDRASALHIACTLMDAVPRAPDAHHLHALCLAEASDAVATERAFRTAVLLAPDATPILVNFSKWLRRQGRGEVLLPALREAGCRANVPLALRLQLGLAELDVHAWPSALAAFNALLRDAPNLVSAWVGRGNALRGAGEDAAAINAFSVAIDLEPECVAAWVNTAAIHRQHGRIDEALSCLRRVEAFGGMTPEIEDLLHGVLADAGHEQEALSRALGLVLRVPDFVPGHVSLVHLLWEFSSVSSRDYVDPLARFRAAAQAEPHHLSLQMAFVRSLLEMRLGEEATQFADALRSNFGDGLATLWLSADAAVLTGHEERAEVLFGKAIACGGADNPAFLNAYVRCLIRIGRWQDAAKFAGRATALDSGNQEGWALLGTAWRLLGDSREDWLCDYEGMVGFLEVAPPGGVSQDEFLRQLASTLEPMHRAQRAPANQSLRQGSQTRGHLFGRNDPTLSYASEALFQAASRWLKSRTYVPDHPFLGRVRQPFGYAGSWSVKLQSSGRHANHIHPQGCLSSAFYVALPNSIETDRHAGSLQLGQPMRELGTSLAPRRVIRPKLGWLALFPSYMWHGTVPFEGASSRLTIAFDMSPERTR